MAPKKASNDRPAPRRIMPRRAAAPGNLNVTHLQRTQEAAARAAAAPAATRPTQKRSRAVVKKSETPKFKKPACNQKRGRPASKKTSSKKEEKEKKKPVLKKVKNSRVTKAASGMTGKSSGRRVAPQSPASGSSELSSPVDFSPIEEVVPLKKTTSKTMLNKVKNGRVTKPASSNGKTRQQSSPSESSSLSSPMSSLEEVLPPRPSTPEVTASGSPSRPPQRTPQRTPQKTPQKIPNRTPQGPPNKALEGTPKPASKGTPRGPASGMPSETVTRTPTGQPKDVPRGINGTPSTLSRTPRPTTPVSSPREILSAVPRRLAGRTPMGPRNRFRTGVLTGTPSTLSRTPRAWESSSASPVSAVSQSPEQNRLPEVNRMNEGEPYNPNDPNVEYVEVWDSEADKWELRTVRRT
ncbi:uncharacterized protein yc1106_00716 [Curvularia clavata]|uniref:Uncharacterized protein n=1 Tax=Curvularia clavata TaxID=95742 RepID=A0A9Q8Z0I4_CURCL|nr:uncharacterized protein yc1106_00716 [Curvularia clavata]